MNKISQLIIAAVLGSTAVSAYALDGYLTDVNGVVVRNTYNKCWRTGTWTPAKAIEECDPELVKKAEPATEAKIDMHPSVAPVSPVAKGPEKPAFEKVTLQAETLFNFDKAVLRPEGKDKLNDLVGKMKSAPEIEVALVTGHADRIGAAKYNQKLSEKRADAVKAYLVSQGIDAGRIKTAGKGEMEPVTQVQDCKGKKGGKLIACLQPDRRVVVEVGVQRPKN